MKRILCILLVVLMCLTAAPLTGFAEMDFAVKASALDVGTCGDNATYNFDSGTGTLLIKGTGAIYEEAFYKNDKIISVFIDNGIDVIGTSAFRDCENLVNVKFGNSLTIIGDGAFAHCKKLENFELPDSLTTICDTAFYDCDSLGCIVVPDSVTSVGNNAFFDCSHLNRVVLGAGVKTIGNEAFAGCKKLEYINIPKGVEKINYCTFADCWSLGGITIPAGVTYISEGAFYECRSLGYVKYKGTVEKWHSIDIAEDNDVIKNTRLRLFSGEHDLLSNSGTCGDNATYTFNRATGELIISGTGTFSGTEFAQKDIIKKLIINEGITAIANQAFSNCDNLTDVVIADSVEKIKPGAFIGCYRLESVVFGKGLTSIGACAFYGCDSLLNVVLPDGVTELGAAAFYDCEKLESVTIPKSVKTIYSGNFLFCENLTDVYYMGSEDDWNAIVKEDDDCLENATIHFKHYHDLTHVDYESGNCITTGHIEHYKCPCGKFFKDADCNYELAWEEIELPLDPTNHKGYKEVSVKIPSTCTTKGSVKMECACGDPKTVEFDIDPTAHEFDGDRCTLCGAYSGCNHGNVEFFPEIQPTCEANGYIAHYICHDCKNTVIPIEDGSYKIYNKDCTLYAEGHKLVTDEGYKPTCTSVGKTYSEYCQNCFYSIGGDEIPMLRHDYSNGKCKSCGNSCEHLNVHFNPSKPALCEYSGHKDFYYCSDCGEYLLDNNGLVIATKDEINIPATGHNWDVGTVTTEPTCEKSGIKTFTCQNTGCGATKTEETTKASHIYGTYTLTADASCTANAKETATCTICNEATHTRDIPATKIAHSFKNYVSNNDATCLQDGTMTAVCEMCRTTTDTKADVGSKDRAEHKANIFGTKCTLCGAELGCLHTYSGEKLITKVPTCTANGEKANVCSKCNERKPGSIELVPPTGHKFITLEVVIAVNCTTDGLEKVICSDCGITADRNVPALGHDMSKFQITKEADCTTEGTMTQKCTRCPRTVTETIPATGHSFPENWNTILTPNCQEKGVAIRICFGCHDVETKALPKTGHADKDGDSYCDTCNLEITVVKPSDPEKDNKKDEECSCNCHAGGIKAFFFKLTNFFAKIFNKDARTCECGEAH